MYKDSIYTILIHYLLIDYTRNNNNKNKYSSIKSVVIVFKIIKGIAVVIIKT